MLVSPNDPGPRLVPYDDLIYIETARAPSANDTYFVDVLANDLVDPAINLAIDPPNNPDTGNHPLETFVQVIEQPLYGTYYYNHAARKHEYKLENPPGPVSFVDQFSYRLEYADGNITSSETATVELSIFPSWRPPEGVESTGKAVTARANSNSQAMRDYLDIYCAQLVFILLNSGISQQSEALKQSDQQSKDTFFSSRGNAETEARTVKVFQDYLPGLVALVAGEDIQNSFLRRWSMT